MRLSSPDVPVIIDGVQLVAEGLDLADTAVMGRGGGNGVVVGEPQHGFGGGAQHMTSVATGADDLDLAQQELRGTPPPSLVLETARSIDHRTGYPGKLFDRCHSDIRWSHHRRSGQHQHGGAGPDRYGHTEDAADLMAIQPWLVVHHELARGFPDRVVCGHEQINDPVSTDRASNIREQLGVQKTLSVAGGCRVCCTSAIGDEDDAARHPAHPYGPGGDSGQKLRDGTCQCQGGDSVRQDAPCGCGHRVTRFGQCFTDSESTGAGM